MMTRVRKFMHHPGRFFSPHSERVRSGFYRVNRFLHRSDFRARREMAERLSEKGKVIPRDDGFLAMAPGSFVDVSRVMESALEIVRQSRATLSSENWDAKQQLRKELLDPASLDLQSPYMQLAAHPEVLASVSRYLGVFPVLAYIDIWVSRHTDTAFDNSQLYHCDHADVSQVKLFIHATDVGDDVGPLTVIPAKVSAVLRRKLNYYWSNPRYRVEDHEVEREIGLSNQVVLTGKAGATAFVDTCRCFHYGSRVKDPAKNRVVVVFQYLSPYGFALPHDYVRDLPFRRLAGETQNPELKFLFGNGR